MNLTMQQKRGLAVGFGILMIAVLTSAAWAQITSALSHCFLSF